MRSTEQENDTGNSLSKKWIYVIIVTLILGFGVYGYIKVKQWVRYAAIEKYEKPITDYAITKVYTDDHQPRSHRGSNDDDEYAKDPDYYMVVSYKGKDYKLEIEEYTFRKINNSEDVILFYDNEDDEVFVAGTGGSNLLVTALIAAAVVIIIVMLIRQLIKSSRKKLRMKNN